MIEPEILSLIQGASLGAIFGVVMILLIRAAPGLMAEYRRIEEVRNEGRKQDSEAQANIVLAGTKAVETAVKAMQDAQAQSRVFYIEKLEEMRKGMSLLEGRVRDLEEENEEKDKRIEELEHENEKLRSEVDSLRRRADKSPARKPAPRKKVA